MVRSRVRQVADGPATTVIGATPGHGGPLPIPRMTSTAATGSSLARTSIPSASTPRGEHRLGGQALGERQETGKGAANSVAAVEPAGVDQLDIPKRLASAEKLGRKAFLRETQEFRFVSTQQVANVAQSLELLNPKGRSAIATSLLLER